VVSNASHFAHVILVFGTFFQISVFMSATGQQQTPHKAKKKQVEQVKSFDKAKSWRNKPKKRGFLRAQLQPIQMG